MTLTQINSKGIKDGEILDADINASAAIARTKLANVDVVDDTSPQLGGDLDTNSFEILLDDDHKIKFGDDADMNLRHTGSYGILENSTGALYLRSSSFVELRGNNNETFVKGTENGAVELYYANSKKFETTSGGVKATGNIELTENVYLSDNKKLLLGDAQDLQIYHNGAAWNVIDNLNNKNFAIQMADGTENAIVCSPNAAVKLYYDGAEKLQTTTDGVQILGNLVIGTSGKGIDFSAVSDTGRNVDTNILDDYEEGFFSPTLGWSLTPTTSTGRFTKVGRLVTYTLQLVWPTNTNGNYVLMGGLPFNGMAGGNAGGGFIRYTNYSGGSDLSFHQNSNNSLTVYNDSGTTITNQTLSGLRIDLVGFYYVA